DIQAQYRSGSTALHLAADPGYRDIVELLLAAGAAVNATDKGGYTPLCDAARKGRADIVQMLLAKGAAVNTRAGETGFTPLHLAAAGGDARVVQMLLAHDADRAAKDNFGAMPLETAARLHHTDAVQALLSPGPSSGKADLLSEA